MNPKHVHSPASTRPRCPVCHEPTYSKGGIHPQCAVRRNDPPRPKGEPVKAIDEAAVAVVAVVEPEEVIPAIAPAAKSHVKGGSRRP